MGKSLRDKRKLQHNSVRETNKLIKRKFKLIEFHNVLIKMMRYENKQN